jgi:glyoxylase-like metal-dependent hydrolase (beta-lactamase superfamily II)
MMLQVEKLPINKQFSRRLIKPNTWVINCASLSVEAPNPHVLVGERAVMVVDTTDTALPLRAYLETYVTEGKPIVVASTHSHLDHTACNGQFNDCPIYMSPVAWQEIQQQRATHAMEKRYPGYPVGDYTPILVQEGDVIDLGGREVEVIAFGGCHSNSSIGYLDRTYGIFFPGDEMESGQVLMQGDDRGGRNCVELYRENLLHLKQWEGQFDMICPPHNGTPIHAAMIDDMIENCDRIMSGIEGERDIGSVSYLLGPNEPRPPERVQRLRFDPMSRRSEWKGTSIVYSIDRIFKDQIT